MEYDTNIIEHIIDNNMLRGGSLISILQDIQLQYGYLDRDVLTVVCERMGIPLSQAYSVTTFYHSFSLKPRGKHKISVCLGTACHVNGAGNLLNRLMENLGVKSGETTKDLLFTLEGVRCLGCCSLAPVVRIDEETYGHLNQSKLLRVIKKYAMDSKTGI